MPQGAPDFWTYARTSQWAAMGALGELTARLQPFIAFDRRGDVFWWDSLEQGQAAWIITGSPVGWSGTIATDQVRLGGYSLKLVTNDSVDAYVNAQHRQPGLPSGRLGLELHMAFSGGDRQWYVQITTWDGTTQTTFQVRDPGTTGTFQYLDEDGVLTNFGASIDTGTYDEMFMPIKLVVNPATGQYVRFVFGSLETDMSGLLAQTAVSANEVLTYYDFRAIHGGDGPATAWLDSVILTRNEPA